MQNIQRVSFWFRALFQILFIVMPLLLLLFWLNAPTPIPRSPNFAGLAINFIPQGIEVLGPLSIASKSLGFLICLLPVGVMELILYFLIKLFRLYEKGNIFTLANVKAIKNIAWILLLGEIIINPIFQALISLALTIHNPPGYRYIKIGIDGTNIGLVLTALLIILISWIMAEGVRLHEEQQYTI